MSGSLRDVLPPVYGVMLSELFDQPEVVESRATCNDCAMCDKGQGAPVALSHFRPDVKCCSFHPHLPNFLVGALLADPSPELEEGRRRIRAKIAQRIGVSPLNIAPSRKYVLHATASQDAGVFGRTKALLCPYFAEEGGGQCTIWKHREAVCSTFFCKYSDGKRGYLFWSALKEYLGYIENALARHAARTVDDAVTYPNVPRGKLTFEDLEDRPPNDADYAKLWAGWVGREEQFYIACHEQVRALRREDFARNVDESPGGKTLLAEVAMRYRELRSKELPNRLVRNTKMREHPVEGAVVVVTYNANDSFSIEKDLYDALGMLDTKGTLAENLARLEREQGIELAPELLEYLFVHGVLVTPAAAAVGDCQTSD